MKVLEMRPGNQLIRSRSDRRQQNVKTGEHKTITQMHAVLRSWGANFPMVRLDQDDLLITMTDEDMASSDGA